MGVRELERKVEIAELLNLGAARHALPLRRPADLDPRILGVGRGDPFAADSSWRLRSLAPA